MDKAKQAARAAGKQVIDLSIGTSDLAPPPEALATLQVSPSKNTAADVCLDHPTPKALHA
jgi:aspartate/methionine/tyrosine aminotransferase